MRLSGSARVVLAGAVVFAAAQALLLDDRLHLTRLNLHDATTYLLLGRNLAEGNGYSASPGLVYPNVRLWLPGLPLYLSGWIRAFGMDLLVLNGAMVLLALAAIAAVYRFAKTLAPPRTAAVLTLLTMAHPLTFSLAHQPLADIPGLLMGAICLALLPRLGERSRGAAAGIGVLAGMASLVKGHNMGLAAAFAFLAWRDRRSPSARANAWIALAGFTLVWGAWTLRNALLEGEGYSGISIAQLVLRLDADDSQALTPYAFWRRIRTVVLYNLPRSFAACVLPWPGFFLRGTEAHLLLGGVLSLVLAVGLVRRLAKGPGPVEAFWIGAFLVVVPTTSQAAGFRHMAPFLPVTLWYVLQGFEALVRGSRRLLLAGAALALVSSLLATLLFARANHVLPQGTADLRDLATIARRGPSGRQEYVFSPRADFVAVVRDCRAWHRLDEWMHGWKTSPDLHPTLIVPVAWIEGEEWGNLDVADIAPAPGPCPSELRSPPWRLVERVGRFGLYRRDPSSEH